MTQYYRKNTSYGRQRKKYKVNKIRFTVVCLILLSLVSLIGFGIGYLFKPNVSVEAIVSEDMNDAVGEMTFNVALAWGEIDHEKYDEIEIIVNDERYTLSSSERQFELTLTEEVADTKVEFIVKRDGFGYDLKEKIKFTTPADNQSLNQQLTDFEVTDREVILTQQLALQNNVTASVINMMKVELISPINGVIFSEQPKIIDETSEQLTTELRIPLEKLTDEFGVKVTTIYSHQKTTIRSILKQENMNATLTQDETAAIKVSQEQGDLLLTATSFKTQTYENHHFYAESLHIETEEIEPPKTYTLVSTTGVDKKTYELGANNAIELNEINSGTYFVQLDDQYIACDQLENSDVWYTVTRDGKSKEVKLERSFGKLVLTINTVNQLPENVYDIIVDPGHGGLDGGTVGSGTNERDEILKVAEYVTKRLEDHGLKVKLTRTDESDPVGPGKFDYEKSPYMENGRVEQVYQHQAKYVISNHLNAFDTTLQGYQVYSSVASDDKWSSLISDNLLDVGHIARDSEKNEDRVSMGSFKKAFVCKPGSLPYECFRDTTDYMYYIRETGGQLSHATSLAEFNETYMTTPTYGAETILIEYAYLDNDLDYKAWLENYEAWGEAVVKATMTYLNIPYQTK